MCEKILEGVQVAFYKNNQRLENMRNVVKAQKLAVACCVAIATHSGSSVITMCDCKMFISTTLSR